MVATEMTTRVCIDYTGRGTIDRTDRHSTKEAGQDMKHSH